MTPPPLPPPGPSRRVDPGGEARPPPLPSEPERTADLLGELPAVPARPEPHRDQPPDEAAVRAAASAAAAYERQLREKLAQGAARPKGFVRRNFVPLALASVVLLSVLAGFTAWRWERAATREADIERFLAAARNGLSRDTLAAYRASLEALEEVLDRAPGHPVASSLKAQALAILAEVYGQGDPWIAERLVFGPGAIDGDRDALLVARWFLARKDGSDAVRAAVEAEVLADPPEDAGATLLSLSGAVLLQKGQPAEAIERFNAAIRASPGHVPTLVRVGDYYRGRGEHGEALRYYGLALTVAEDHPGALIGAAESTLATAREPRALEQALADLGKLRTAEQVPVADRLRLALVRARLRAALGTRDDGLAELEGVEPGDDPADVVALARTFARVGAADVGLERLAPLDLAASPDPALREAHAELLVAAERFREAARLRARPTDRGLLLQIGIARYHLGEYARARNSLHATVLAGKLPADAVVYLALVDLATGKADKARKNLARLGTGSRARTAGRWAYAELLRREGNLAEAERVLREAVEAEPRAFEARCALGRLLVSTKRSDEALEHLREAVRLAPLHVEGRRALAGVLEARGDEEEAAGHWAAVVDQAPEDVDALDRLANLWIQAGEVDRAEERVRAILRAFPRSADANLVLAKVLIARGSTEEAAATLRRSLTLAPRGKGAAEARRLLARLR
ncbi:MAG TPA: tetratricopeptide repeat protein [Vulgatibacter sp.]|nr:tetratricopeptide repeat protein [Vulgatibacter sp.]